MDKISCQRMSPHLAVIRLPYFNLDEETAFTNVYLIIDRELVLIDAGPYRNDSGYLLSTALEKQGFSIKDISRIIYTHAHPDHMGGGIGLIESGKFSQLAYWEAIEGAEQYGRYVRLLKSISKDVFSEHLKRHPVEKDAYFKVIDLFWQPTSGEIKIDHGVHDKEVIRTGHLNLEVIHTPGHSPWDISLWDEKNETLFTGDFLLANSTTFTGSLKDFGSNLVSYESSLKKVKTFLMRAKRLFPSHGPPVSCCSNLADDISRLIKLREQRILEQLSATKQSLVSLRSRIFSSEPSPIILVRQLGILLCHLERLEIEQKVVRLKEDDVILYELKDCPSLLNR